MDANQAEIVECLRAVPDCKVVVLSTVGNGCPDLLIGFRGFNFLVELKNPDVHYNQKLPTIIRQDEFRRSWPGQVLCAYSLKDIVTFMSGFQFRR